MSPPATGSDAIDCVFILCLCMFLVWLPQSPEFNTAKNILSRSKYALNKEIIISKPMMRQKIQQFWIRFDT